MASNGSYCCVINCSNNAPKCFRLFIFRYLNLFIIFLFFFFINAITFFSCDQLVLNFSFLISVLAIHLYICLIAVWYLLLRLR